MFGKSKSKKNKTQHKLTSTNFDTLISSKTEVEGDICFAGGLHIDGVVKGAVKAKEESDAVVRISDIGKIEGDVIAPHIIVNGRVDGDVYASKHIELAENASIEGNVYYHLIEMSMGAEVNGNLVHHKEPVGVSQHPSVEEMEGASPKKVVKKKAVPLQAVQPQTKS